jgi:hypothetical protein
MVATKKCMLYLVIREGDYKKIARFINGLDTMRVAGRLPRRHFPPTVARLRPNPCHVYTWSTKVSSTQSLLRLDAIYITAVGRQGEFQCLVVRASALCGDKLKSGPAEGSPAR